MWCEVVTDFKRLEELAPEWQRLAHGDPQADIFQQWDWARAFWKTYGKTYSLCSPVVHQDSRIIGILPLVRKGEVIACLGSPESDYNDLLCEDCNVTEVLEAVLDVLLGLSISWRSATFDNLPAHSQILRHLPALPRSLRKHLQLIFRCPSPAVVLNANGGQLWSRLIAKERPRRDQQRLQRLGHLVFRHIENRDEAREHLGRFFQQHITRCATAGFESQFLEAERRAFFEALVEHLDPRTQLRFGTLELNSQSIAYHFGFQLNGKFTLYKPTFDVNYWDYSPGDVLLRNLFQYAQKAAVNEFDFSIGNEPYKSRFANEVRKNYALHVDRHPARIPSRVNQLARHARQTLRQKPVLSHFLKRNVGRLKAAVSYLSFLLRNEDMLNCCRDAIRAGCQKAIWARDEVLLFSGMQETEHRVPSVEIAAGALDALARLSVEYPEFLSEDKLREYRKRLKRGDEAFVVRGRRDTVSVFWVGKRAGIMIPEIGRSCDLPLDAPAMVIYEFWTAPHFHVREVPAEFLRALAGKYPGMSLWVYCMGRQRALRQAVEEAGFQLRQRVSHRTLFYWFRRTLVSSSLKVA